VRKRLGMVDLDTGEVLEGGVPVWFGARPRSPYGNRWVAMSQSFLEEFAARKDVRGETLRVFLYLNARLDFENMIHLPMIEVAEALAMRRQNVNRAMRQLETLGVILRDPRTGRVGAYRLNPNAGWKGRVANLRKRLELVEQ
jgi:hypothetical protein